MGRRAVLVTGAARGIGRAIAGDLARDHDIAITYNAAADEAAAFVSAHPGALAVRWDARCDDPAALGRLALDGEVAAAVRFLLSEAGSG